MTTATATRTRFDTQPDAVRAVIDLAETEGNERIVALLVPKHADTLTDIADKLNWIDRLETEDAKTVLSDYWGQPIGGIYLDQAADVLADELRVDVVCSAQLVASLIGAGR